MTYPTDLLTVNAFIISSGGTGGHATMLSALNELCTLQSVAHDNVTNLPALNALWLLDLVQQVVMCRTLQH